MTRNWAYSSTKPNADLLIRDYDPITWKGALPKLTGGAFEDALTKVNERHGGALQRLAQEPASFLTPEEAQLYILKQKLAKKTERIAELEQKLIEKQENLNVANRRLFINRVRSRRKNIALDKISKQIGIVDKILNRGDANC